MSIKQLNASYVSAEDRVVMRVTTTDDKEYRLLLTRAKLRELLGLLRMEQLTAVAKEHLTPMAADIAEFKQQFELNNAKFTAFEPASQLPLGDQPLMVRKVDINRQDTKEVLELHLAGKLLKLPLTEELSRQIVVVLQTIADQARWDLPATLPQTADEEMTSSPVLPAAKASQKLLH